MSDTKGRSGSGAVENEILSLFRLEAEKIRISASVQADQRTEIPRGAKEI